MHLRRATAADAESIIAFWRASGATVSVTDSPAYVIRAIDHPGTSFLLATVDDRLVGSVIGTFDGWRGNIYRLVVRRDMRRQGIARTLVREVEKVFREWKVKRINALVESDHEDALEFWSAVGYTRDPHMLRHMCSLEDR
jgi:ribosomal protein S18 acetylase RimI-like enzyme